MNIFYLDPDPIIAARYHCDQHLGKMILESAQMISSAGHHLNVHWEGQYKPAYMNHPCTLSLLKSKGTLDWVVHLCYELQRLRSTTAPHSSLGVVTLGHHHLWAYLPQSNEVFLDFCGPDEIKYRPSLSLAQKYQLLYIKKYKAWLDTPRSMSYKERPLPFFLHPFKDSIQHEN